MKRIRMSNQFNARILFPRYLIWVLQGGTAQLEVLHRRLCYSALEIQKRVTDNKIKTIKTQSKGQRGSILTIPGSSTHVRRAFRPILALCSANTTSFRSVSGQSAPPCHLPR